MRRLIVLSDIGVILEKQVSTITTSDPYDENREDSIFPYEGKTFPCLETYQPVGEYIKEPQMTNVATFDFSPDRKYRSLPISQMPTCGTNIDFKEIENKNNPIPIIIIIRGSFFRIIEKACDMCGVPVGKSQNFSRMLSLS
jgi:hypothetical protein